jgi:hypothetical protein
MKITLEINGGFAHIPALNRPVVVDTAQIEPALATQLEALVRQARFFELPAQSGTTAARGAADLRTFTLTVRDQQRSNTVHFNEPIANADLGRLVSSLEAIARASRI